MARMVTMVSSSLQRFPAMNPTPTNVRVRPALPFSAQSRRLALLHLGSGFHQARMFVKGTSTNMRVEGNMTQAGAIVSEESLQEWSKKDNRRLLHVVYRVGDLEKTIKFYTECLGMKLLRKRDIPEERYTNVFLGFGPEETHFVVELTYNYGVDSYNLGAGFGHFGVAVEDNHEFLGWISL